MKIIGIIQARMNSKRLPGKVMLDLAGKPVIWHIFDRLGHSELLDEVIISTGDNEENLSIIDFAKMHDIPYFQGKENDLIDRIYQTALHFDADAVIRVTGDCPLVEPKIVDEVIAKYLKLHDKYDIVTNHKVSTFPHGLDFELYSIYSLKKMWDKITQSEFREWFPTYIDANPHMFRILNISNKKDLSNLRWTLDYVEDYQLIKTIYEKLYKKNNIFSMEDVLELIKIQPELMEINSKYVDHHNIDAPEGPR